MVAWVWPDIGSAGAKMGFVKKELLMLLLMGGGQPSLSSGSPWPSLSAWSRGHSSVPSPVAIHHPDVEFLGAHSDSHSVMENQHCSIPELGRTFLLVPVSSTPSHTSPPPKLVTEPDLSLLR